MYDLGIAIVCLILLIVIVKFFVQVHNDTKEREQMRKEARQMHEKNLRAIKENRRRFHHKN